MRVTTGADLAAEARPLPQADPLKVDMASLLPPGVAAMVDALDNSGAAAAAAEPDEEEVATLDFVGDDLPERTFALKYPFNWEGTRHDNITVRQLTTGQVGRVSAEWARTQTAPQLMDVYAVMTSLPARVLRALPDVDGRPIIDAAYDFLPLSYRGEGG